MWPILLATCTKLGAVPEFPGKKADWIPVDVAAQSIVEILTHLQYPSRFMDKIPGIYGSDSINRSCKIDESRRNYTVHNIVNPHRVPWSDIVEMLQRSEILGRGKKLRVVSMVEWVRLLNKAADEDISADELPGLRLLGFFEDMAASVSQSGEESIVFDTTRSQAISSSLSACEGYRAEWLEASLWRWKQEGIIGA